MQTTNTSVRVAARATACSNFPIQRKEVAINPWNEMQIFQILKKLDYYFQEFIEANAFFLPPLNCISAYLNQSNIY